MTTKGQTMDILTRAALLGELGAEMDLPEPTPISGAIDRMFEALWDAGEIWAEEKRLGF